MFLDTVDWIFLLDYARRILFYQPHFIQVLKKEDFVFQVQVHNV